MLKRKSIFKKYNREDYRRILAQYFPELQGKFPRKMAWPSHLYTVLLFLPLLYGGFLLLLKDDQEWLEAVISWSSPWLEERLQVYFPSISKVADNLFLYGYSELIPLVQHAYAVGMLFSAVVFIATAFYSWFVYVAPVRQRYQILMHAKGRDAKRDLLAMFCGMILFACGWWYLFVYGGGLEYGNCDALCEVLLSYPSWAVFWLMTAAMFTSLGVAAGALSVYYYFDIIRRERRARNDAADDGRRL